MAERFLHGISTIEDNSGAARYIRSLRSNVIGLIGTAPDADAEVFPLDTPVLLNGSRRKAARLGAAGTLKTALDGIFDQGGATVIVVRVDAADSDNRTLANVIGDRDQQTGLHAFRKADQLLSLRPRVFVAPGFTHTRPSGVTELSVTNGGAGYSADAPPAVSFSGGGSDLVQPRATAEVDSSGAVVKLTLESGGYGHGSAPTVTIAAPPTKSGARQATATATIGDAANPVVAEAQAMLDRFRAVMIVDLDGDTPEEAVTARRDIASQRVYAAWPRARVFDPVTAVNTDDYLSARIAGMISRIDTERGFWWSPSNQVMYGVTGVSEFVDWGISDFESTANYLNENAVTTLVRRGAGFHLWGNRSCSPDALWAFLSVRRTADVIEDSVDAAHLWALDRPFSEQLLTAIVESVNGYLRSLVARGALLGGRCWLDADLNTSERLQAGELYVNYDIEPPAPIERLTFTVSRNRDYYDTVFAAAAAAVARQ